MDQKLSVWRKHIDKIDERIINLLNKRSQIVKKIGLWKKKQKIKTYDKKRWQEVLESRIKIAEDLGLSADFIKDIYEKIHDYSLEIENTL